MQEIELIKKMNMCHAVKENEMSSQYRISNVESDMNFFVLFRVIPDDLRLTETC